MVEARPLRPTQVAPPSAPIPPPPVVPRVVPRAPTATALYDAGPARARCSVMSWLVGGLALAVVVLVAGGLLLLVAPSGDDGDDGAARSGAMGRGDERGNTTEADRRATVTPADVTVPGSAPASVDEAGDPVTFEATNMLDADPRTSWRMAGDGSGAVVTFSFDDPVTVTQVGLINGYAKTDPPHDWYAGNRRIEAVTWVFDDGTEVEQDLAEVHKPQLIPVDAAATTQVELRILDVTEPGGGPDGRDFTAISDVTFVGSH